MAHKSQILVFSAAAILVLAICCIHLSTIFTWDDGSILAEAAATESGYVQPGPEGVRPVPFVIEEKLPSGNAQRSDSGSAILTVGGLRIFCEGDSASRHISRSSVRKYRIDLAGTGFSPDSQALINGASAETLFTNNTRLSCGFPAERISESGLMTVAVRDTAGQLSNTVTVRMDVE